MRTRLGWRRSSPFTPHRQGRFRYRRRPPPLPRCRLHFTRRRARRHGLHAARIELSRLTPGDAPELSSNPGRIPLIPIGDELLCVLCFDTRGIALREPALPTFDRLIAAVATAVGRTDEGAVGEPHPSNAAARTAVFQWTILDRDLTVGLER